MTSRLVQCSLADRVRAAALAAVPEVVAIGITLADALETAHRVGVLHGDVRPVNVLLGRGGEPVLAGFGPGLLRSSRVPEPVGPVGFRSVHVAPELFLGQRVGPATDVYGLASTLYELLTGTPPFPAFAGEPPAASILRILRDPPAPIVRGDVPLQFCDLLLWALAKEPAERPPSAAWFGEELRRVRSGLNSPN